MNKGPYFDRKTNLDKDVVLCSTTNYRASTHAAYILTQENISFTRKWNPIPRQLRKRYRDYDKMCEISINRNEYSKARRAINKLDPCYFNRLVINII